MAKMSTITIRAARLDDVPGIARLDVETWQATYAGILQTPYLAGLSAPRREHGWKLSIQRAPADLRVAVDDMGAIVGFGSCGRCRGEPEFGGEVFTLYVAPDRQNQGIGRALLLALFARLVEAGHGSAVIWVLRSNPARFFYRRLGGREVRQKLLPFNGAEVPASGYGWRDLPQFLATAAKLNPKPADREPGS
jgi:ribosomal protein S18 acetylase RimI-like enzyme